MAIGFYLGARNNARRCPGQLIFGVQSRKAAAQSRSPAADRHFGSGGGRKRSKNANFPAAGGPDLRPGPGTLVMARLPAYRR